MSIGLKLIKALTDEFHNYGIDKKNINAVKAYKKCGFKEIEAFDPSDYYLEENIDEYGDGDYGPEETVNLIYKIE